MLHVVRLLIYEKRGSGVVLRIPELVRPNKPYVYGMRFGMKYDWDFLRSIGGIVIASKIA